MRFLEIVVIQPIFIRSMTLCPLAPADSSSHGNNLPRPLLI